LGGILIKYTDDSRIQGLVETKKANFSKCMETNCENLAACTAVKVRDIQCVYEKPLVQISNSRFDLHTETKNKIKAYFERLLLRYRKPNTFHNVTNQVLLDNLAKHVANESTPDLSAQFLALSSEYGVPSKSSLLVNELGRIAPLSVNRNGAEVVIEGTFGLTDANTLSTNVDTPIDRTQFSVDAVSGAGLRGLAVGDRIQIKLDGIRWYPTQITAISTLTLTIDPAVDVDLSGGEELEQMIARVHLIGGTATLTLDSGDPFSIAPYINTKSSTENIDVTFTITFV
jgi:hypothetical protein